MKTHGILFSAPMIRALLNTQPDVWPAQPIDPAKPWKWQTRRKMKAPPEIGDDFVKVEPCPHPVGSILYAKETFGYGPSAPHLRDRVLQYRADYNMTPFEDEDCTKPVKWKPSIFMPKAAARIWLEVARVRVERVNEITEADAKAEGVQADLHHAIWPFIFNYRHLWDEINGSSSFDSAPWVWVYDLKRIPKPL